MAEELLPWLSILGAWLCFGSFAVPMKSPSVVAAKVHPLVFQFYKTFWTFVTSHLVLLLPNMKYNFTAWGILSGVSWVPAGIASIIAVQNVGIACGQAVWQVTIIGTSFLWGFCILHTDQVNDYWGTAASLICLVTGVVGMTLSFNLKLMSDELESLEASAFGPAGASSMGRPSSFSRSVLSFARDRTRSDLSDVSLSADQIAIAEGGANDDAKTARSSSLAVGIGAALFNGVWGGANLVPSFFSPYKGIDFTLSFSIGAMIVNLLLIMGYVLLSKLVWRSDLPSPELRVMLIPGFLSGSLWSAGNFCSLYAVNALGQGIGYSLIQSSVIVSGCWGIFYYREMKGRPIIYWSVCCLVCLAGALGLAKEKKGQTPLPDQSLASQWLFPIITSADNLLHA